MGKKNKECNKVMESLLEFLRLNQSFITKNWNNLDYIPTAKEICTLLKLKERSGTAWKYMLKFRKAAQPCTMLLPSQRSTTIQHDTESEMVHSTFMGVLVHLWTWVPSSWNAPENAVYLYSLLYRQQVEWYSFNFHRMQNVKNCEAGWGYKLGPERDFIRC